MSMKSVGLADSQVPIRRIEAVLSILFITIAIACQAWQPFRLGFYHDDWGFFVQPRLHAQDIHWLGTWHSDRPGYSIFIKLMLELWDGRTASFHLIKIALDLVTAAAIAWTSLVYQKAFGARSLALATAGAAFWLVAPWSLGYSLWPTAAFNNFSVLFLCLSAISLARWIERNDVISLALSAAAFGASVLFYQSAWLGIFPFALALALREWRAARPLQPTLVAFAALATVQLGSVALSWRYSPKTPNPHIFAAFRDNLIGVTRLGIEHFGKAGNYSLAAATAIAAIAAIILLWRRDGSSRIRAITSLILLLTGIVTTSALYASADYGFVTVGVFSRTTQMVDFWLAVSGAILLASPLGEAAAGRFRCIGYATWLIVVGACTLTYWPAAKPWIRSWELQGSILKRSAPLADVLRDDDVVLSDVPLDIDGVTVFGAPWDITAAVLVRNAERRPDLAYRFPSVQIIPPYAFEMSWIPGTFTITPGWTLPGKRLLLWHWQCGAIATVDHPVADRAELFALFGSRMTVDCSQ